MSNLNNLKKESIYLYFEYYKGMITEQEYLHQIKSLDKAIDKMEIEALRCYLQGSSVFEKSS